MKWNVPGRQKEEKRIPGVKRSLQSCIVMETDL